MRILVTGAKGFIGGHVAKRLLYEGHDVYTTSREDLDLRDRKAVAGFVDTVRPEIIYHFAANAAENKSQFSPIQITENNLMILLNVLVPAINSGMKRIIFPSSVAVYGEKESPLLESDQVVPKDIYAVNKYASEQALKILSKVHGFEYVIARLHNVYGPGQNMTDPYRNVVSIFMNHLLNDEPYSVYGDGSMARCFSYIDDVVDILVLLKEGKLSGLSINIGSDVLTTLNELSDEILEVAKTDIQPIYLADRPQEVKAPKPDHTVCKNMFGYNETPLRDGLEKAWEYCLQKGPQKAKLDGVEINSDKLPENWKT